MTQTWLSQQAYDRLSAELEELRTDARTRISKVIEEARAHGDLRENAEYHTAKDEQGHIEARIRQLEQLLATAQIGEPSATDIAAPGLLVTLAIDGDEETYLMVASREDRSDTYDVLSTSSPLGSAVSGAKVGDRVRADAPSGSYEVTVKEIRAP